MTTKFEVISDEEMINDHYLSKIKSRDGEEWVKYFSKKHDCVIHAVRSIGNLYPYGFNKCGEEVG